MNRNERYTKWEIILAVLFVILATGFVLAYVVDVWILPRL